MFRAQGCYFSLPTRSGTNIAQELFDVYRQRMLRVAVSLKKSPLREHATDKYKFAFFAAFILCEIELFKIIAQKNPGLLSFSLKQANDTYIPHLEFICARHLQKQKNSRGVSEGLSLLQQLPVDSVDLITLQKNDIFQEAYLKIIDDMVANHYCLAGYVRSYSLDSFRLALLLQTDSHTFSWSDPEVLRNPWMMAYRNFFLCDSEGNVNTFDDFNIEKSHDFFVERKTGPQQENKIMLYTKSKTVMAKKIDVIKRWTARADSTVELPESLQINQIEYALPPLDIIIEYHLRNRITPDHSKNWYSVDISPIIPTMVRTLYQRLPAYSNCYGAARVAAGITPFLDYAEYDRQDRALTSLMTPVHTGYLQPGDLVFFDESFVGDFHGFIYLDADLSLSMNFCRAPWRFQATRDVLDHEDFPSNLPYRLCSTYDHVGEHTREISWAKVYRKTQPSPCWENKEVLDVITNIYEIMIAHPELVIENYASSTAHSRAHPQYPLLLENLTQLKELTKGYPHFDKHIKTLLDRLHVKPDEIKPTEHTSKKLRLTVQ